MPPPRLMRPSALRPFLSRTKSSRTIVSFNNVHRKSSPQLSPPTASLFLHTSFARSFCNSTPRFKKVSRKEREAIASSSAEEIPDPSDFSSLNDDIARAQKKLEVDLSKLRTGGRFNPEILENLKVQLSKDVKKSERLGDLAQVIPKGGRSLTIIMGEADHVKPIVSAIQGSKNLNLQPQQDPHNANQLTVPIPPPTKESRDLALTEASKLGDAASLAVKNARAAMHKTLRALELKKVVRPDDLKKAHKEMEKIVEKGQADVKKMVDTAKKTMEQV